MHVSCARWLGAGDWRSRCLAVAAKLWMEGRRKLACGQRLRRETHSSKVTSSMSILVAVWEWPGRRARTFKNSTWESRKKRRNVATCCHFFAIVRLPRNRVKLQLRLAFAQERWRRGSDQSPHPTSQCSSERWPLYSVHGRFWPRKRFRPAAFRPVNGPCTEVYGCSKNAVGVQDSATKRDNVIGVGTTNRTPYVVLRSSDRIFQGPRLRCKEGHCTRRPKVQ